MKLRQKMIVVMLIVMILSSYITILTNAVIAVGNDIVNQNIEANSKLNNKLEEATVEKQESTNENSKDTDTNIDSTQKISKAEISIKPESLSTVVTNRNVELTAVLDTSNHKNALYKNPTLQIVLPKDIENVEINSVNLLFEDELKIKGTKLEEQDGKKVIKITLEGTQTKYINQENITKEQSNIIAKGATVVIQADITFNKLTPSTNSKVYLYYTNENTSIYEKTQKQENTDNLKETNKIGIAETEVEVVAPVGIISENHINGYEKNKEISNITAENKIETIETHKKAEKVTIGGTIVNNYNNSVDNVTILGRTPAKGNIALDKNQNLTSNFTMKMQSEIEVTGLEEDEVNVYYSTNANATNNVELEENKWTQNPKNLGEVKSYLIVLNDEIEEKTELEFNYEAEIPANLSYSNYAYTNYAVTYNNLQEDATLEETTTSGIVGLTTGEEPELKINITSSVTTAREGEIVTIIATIKNEGSIIAKDAKLHIQAPEGTSHISTFPINEEKEQTNGSDKTINLGNIEPNETVTEQYELRMTKALNVVNKELVGCEASSEEINEEEVYTYPGDKDIENVVTATAENQNKESKSNTLVIRRLEGDLSIIAKTATKGILQKGSQILYEISVENISHKTNLNNITVNMSLPEGIKIADAYNYDGLLVKKDRDNITVNNNDIEVKIDKLYNKNEGNSVKTINLVIEGDGFEGTYDFKVTAQTDSDDTYYSNTKVIKGVKTSLEIEQKNPEKQYVKEGTEYTYHYVIKNKGEITTDDITVEIDIPEGIRLVKAKYVDENGLERQETWSKDNILKLKVNSLSPNKPIDIYVTVAAEIIKDKNNKEIITKGSIRKGELEKEYSQERKVIIEYDSDRHKFEQSSGEIAEKTYRITGKAWIDANKNGQRDDDEKPLAGLEVMLLYKSNYAVVKYAQGKDRTVRTDANGNYEFSNVQMNEYLVLFLYDTGKYDVTDYQKENVGESLNSDAINMKIILDGEQRYAGVSNTIKITNSNARDIDIGLYEAQKFDLRLDKYISKITLITVSGGTKTYNYNNTKIAKCDVYKKDINNSSVIVEYKIVVTNEGTIDGYARKVIDYLPENVKFSSELNKDWYLSNDSRSAYNTSLANEKIAPGQSKEVTLVLSFNITNKNIGTLVSNSAEIYESYNELGLKDIDSNEANLLESEDDISKADIMISIATGKVIAYIILTISIIGIIGLGIYGIKKKVLK